MAPIINGRGGSDHAPPAESVFALRRGASTLTCQLRNHGQWGYEIRVLIDGSLYIMQRGFANREDAIVWAGQQRLAQTSQGWSDDSASTWPTRGWA
jgi:hypothetical protein